MAQLIVRNVDESVKAHLQRRARRNGRSMEEEVRDILRDAVKDKPSSSPGLGSEISSLFSKDGLEADIPELRGYQIKPVRFEQ
jgi:plasmid stability protein